MKINDLQSKGFVSVPYPDDIRLAVVQVAHLWKQFCALPQEVKLSLPYSNSADGVGYEYKDGSGPKGDTKENFDITLAGHDWVQKNFEHLIDNPVATLFVDKAVSLVTTIKPLVLDFAQHVEEAFRLQGFAEEVLKSEAKFFIRFIHYPSGRDVGEETATAHTDQSGFTLHLFESTPGLEGLTLEKQWVPLPVSSGQTVIIPSMQMQLRSKGDLKALCHRVVVTPEALTNERYSAVCFIQLGHTPKYDKKTHGRLQEKVPGFNYGMSHEEFEKLFM